jgi:hypothetical protein
MRDLFENDSKSLARDEARAALRNIVRRLTGKVAAAATGLAESHVSKALSDEPGDRYLRDEHIDALLRLATPAEVTDYWCARMGAYGLRTEPVKPLSVEEHYARLQRRVIAEFGAAGQRLVDAEESEK